TPVKESSEIAQIVVEELPPVTQLMIRNLSSRPTAIIEIVATNSRGDILLDIDGMSPGGNMPIRIEPWDIKIISTKWLPGEQAENLFLLVKDIEERETKVTDYTNNHRIPIGADALSNFKRKYRNGKMRRFNGTFFGK
ncbi:MAG TPA: hypothetical protein VFV64_14470, partial [Permianibacter sp.]|nr:hypothetical protein [Permianibacter sp.]